MSQANVETVLRTTAALARGDRDAVLAGFHPDAEWRDLHHPPDTPESVRGEGALQGLWDEWERAFPGFSVDTDECLDAGDRVVTLTHWWVQGRSSGLTLDLRTWDVFEFADGKIARVTTGYADRSAALKAVGVEE